jgi:hypothetical protein
MKDIWSYTFSSFPEKIAVFDLAHFGKLLLNCDMKCLHIELLYNFPVWQTWGGSLEKPWLGSVSPQEPKYNGLGCCCVWSPTFGGLALTSRPFPKPPHIILKLNVSRELLKA